MCRKGSFRKYSVFASILMVIGLVGRLVAGSIPFPPMSPFSDPHFHSSSAQLAHSGSVSDKQFVQTTVPEHKKTSHEIPSRPWYALRIVNFPIKAFYSLEICIGHFPEALPNPILENHLRPPNLT